jgi:hypothetical protein
LIFWLVTNITSAFAGKTPPVGSNITPQLPAEVIAAFNAATFEAVVAFWIKPSQGLATFGQLTFKGVVVKFIDAEPTLKRTISLYPSSFTGKFGEQASTKILSIEKHCAVAFDEKNKRKSKEKVRNLEMRINNSINFIDTKIAELNQFKINYTLNVI